MTSQDHDARQGEGQVQKTAKLKRSQICHAQVVMQDKLNMQRATKLINGTK